MIKYLPRVFYHLRNGSLRESIIKTWRLNRWEKGPPLWDSLQGRSESFEIDLQPDVRMNMYFDSVLCRWIYRGDFELEERDFVNAFLRPDDVFIDVGANIGVYSLIAGYCVGRWGTVYSFEPHTTTFKRLCENVRLNQLENVVSFRMALSDKDGVLPLQISTDGFDAWNSFAKPNDNQTVAVEEVKCVQWDTFAAEQDLAGRTTIMKMDVEGWESRVLSGGKKVLSRDDAPVLLIEFSDSEAEAAESSCAEVYNSLLDLGYQIFIYDHKNRSIIPDPLREAYEFANLIAAKDPAFVQDRINTQIS